MGDAGAGLALVSVSGYPVLLMFALLTTKVGVLQC